MHHQKLFSLARSDLVERKIYVEEVATGIPIMRYKTLSFCVIYLYCL